MRRDEQCSPVLVLLVCWPQCRRPRHAIRGDGSDGGRVVGRGTIKHMSIYGGTSSTVLYGVPINLVRRWFSGGGGVGVYLPALGRQGSRARPGGGRMAGMAAWPGGQLRNGRRRTQTHPGRESRCKGGRPQHRPLTLHTPERCTRRARAERQGAHRSRLREARSTTHNRFGMLARMLSR